MIQMHCCQVGAWSCRKWAQTSSGPFQPQLTLFPWGPRQTPSLLGTNASLTLQPGGK